MASKAYINGYSEGSRDMAMAVMRHTTMLRRVSEKRIAIAIQHGNDTYIQWLQAVAEWCDAVDQWMAECATDPSRINEDI